jgi:NAD(P) transhydrogenase subunit alpha
MDRSAVLVFVPKEKRAGEARVAATPETVKRLVQQGFEVGVEPDAGALANLPNADFEAAGAKLRSLEEGRSSADVMVTLGPIEESDAARIKESAVVIGLLAPYRSDAAIRKMVERKITSFALELLPRTTRAQPMDALSSQASIAGYKAVLLAAERLGKYFPLLMTAAGTIQPARVVVLGAGVAGLQAIATAKRLGAIVEVSDIRAAAKEEAESLGGKFIQVPIEEGGQDKGAYAKEVSKEFLAKQQALVGERIAAAHVVICTALVPGRPAPKLVPEEVVKRMRPGSVIVDLAAPEGGNCALTRPGQEVVENGVRIIGHTNLPATVATDASILYARNVCALLLHITKQGKLALDLTDDITKGTLLTHAGEVVHEATAKRLGVARE